MQMCITHTETTLTTRGLGSTAGSPAATPDDASPRLAHAAVSSNAKKAVACAIRGAIGEAVCPRSPRLWCLCPLMSGGCGSEQRERVLALNAMFAHVTLLEKITKHIHHQPPCCNTQSTRIVWPSAIRPGSQQQLQREHILSTYRGSAQQHTSHECLQGHAGGAGHVGQRAGLHSGGHRDGAQTCEQQISLAFFLPCKSSRPYHVLMCAKSRVGALAITRPRMRALQTAQCFSRKRPAAVAHTAVHTHCNFNLRAASSSRVILSRHARRGNGKHRAGRARLAGLPQHIRAGGGAAAGQRQRARHHCARRHRGAGVCQGE
jgi:hypothetical protein